MRDDRQCSITVTRSVSSFPPHEAGEHSDAALGRVLLANLLEAAETALLMTNASILNPEISHQMSRIAYLDQEIGR